MARFWALDGRQVYGMSKMMRGGAVPRPVNRAQGMPRGWEAYARGATDGQARWLLARLTRDGPVLLDGRNADPEDCSHSLLAYWQDAKGRTHGGIEFTEHLKRQASGELAFREGGMPCYGRYFVSDRQVDAFLEEFPDKRDRLGEALAGYAADGGSYLSYGKPGRPTMYRRLDFTGRPLDVSIGTFSQAVRRAAPSLGPGFRELEREFESSRPLHRLRFEAERVPDAFKGAPVRPKYDVDVDGIRDLLGEEQADGGYEAGYRVVFEFAMDYPMRDDLREIRMPYRVAPPGTSDPDVDAMPWAERGRLPSIPRGLPNGTFLATYLVGGKVRHDVLLSPDLMAECLTFANYEEIDGKYVGAVDAPVYATEMQGALGDADRDGIADDDFPESRSQIQNRGRMALGEIGNRPPAGCVWTADLFSGALRVPEKPLDQALHQKYAALRHREGIAFAKAHDDPAAYDALCRKLGKGDYEQRDCERQGGDGDRMTLFPDDGAGFPF